MVQPEKLSLNGSDMTKLKKDRKGLVQRQGMQILSSSRTRSHDNGLQLRLYPAERDQGALYDRDNHNSLSLNVLFLDLDCRSELFFEYSREEGFHVLSENSIDFGKGKYLEERSKL